MTLTFFSAFVYYRRQCEQKIVKQPLVSDGRRKRDDSKLPQWRFGNSNARLVKGLRETSFPQDRKLLAAVFRRVKVSVLLRNELLRHTFLPALVCCIGHTIRGVRQSWDRNFPCESCSSCWDCAWHGGEPINASSNQARHPGRPFHASIAQLEEGKSWNMRKWCLITSKCIQPACAAMCTGLSNSLISSLLVQSASVRRVILTKCVFTIQSKVLKHLSE